MEPKKRYLVAAFTSTQACEDWLNSDEMRDYVLVSIADTDAYITAAVKLAKEAK